MVRHNLRSRKAGRHWKVSGTGLVDATESKVFGVMPDELRVELTIDDTVLNQPSFEAHGLAKVQLAFDALDNEELVTALERVEETAYWAAVGKVKR